jgi:hypothetical protein
LSFFTKHWGTSDPQVQKKIASRPNPFPGYNPSSARSSLNDLIFEALGSKTNTADFVLYEEGVNAMKAKLWSHINPFESEQWKKIAKDAADGSIPRNRHLAVLRSVSYIHALTHCIHLTNTQIHGVHNYMNSPDVTKRLHESIKNVKTEFSNFKAITGEDVLTMAGAPVDLPALWIEFMAAQLTAFTTGGTDYVKKQVAFALVAKNRQERDMIKLRPADLTALIGDLEADIKQMTDYRAAAVVMKAPKAE